MSEAVSLFTTAELFKGCTCLKLQKKNSLKCVFLQEQTYKLINLPSLAVGLNLMIMLCLWAGTPIQQCEGLHLV